VEKISSEKLISQSVETTRTTDDFQTGQVLTISGGHFIHDTYTAFITPLLPLLQDRLSTGYALTGGLATYAQLPSLLNPFIGYLADRISLRYFIILAPAVTGTLMSSMGLTSNYFMLAFLLFVAGISIAAFHAPAPAMIGRLAGSKIGKGMSIFMASGELGRTIGPVVVVGAVGWFGLEGIWRLALVGWLTSLILYFRLHQVSARPPTQRKFNPNILWPRMRSVFPVLIWVMLARVFMLSSLTTYLPIYMRDVMGRNVDFGAFSLTILEAAGVVGALVTGTVSDRFGRPRVLMFLMTLGPLLLFGFLFGPEWLMIPLLLGLGLTVISPTPVVMAVVQDQFPDNRALANGILLALNFTMRALGIWSVGFAADNIGLINAYMWSGIIGFVGVPAALMLPKKHLSNIDYLPDDY